MVDRTCRRSHCGRNAKARRGDGLEEAEEALRRGVVGGEEAERRDGSGPTSGKGEAQI
jgi:hypothetical protein